tara:strand:- start:942 stop:1106 length:165 start_codon:yes stop_codon:yes gene_type:complete
MHLHASNWSWGNFGIKNEKFANYFGHIAKKKKVTFLNIFNKFNKLGPKPKFPSN